MNAQTTKSERRRFTTALTHFFAEVKTRRYLEKMSTSISLVILTLGFSLLGLLGVIKTLSIENSYAMVGSSISVLLGVAFLVAASLYWSRYSRIMD